MKKGEKWSDEERAMRAANHAKKKEAKLCQYKLSEFLADEDQLMAMNPFDRHELAEQLEKQAAQLRGFKQAPVPFVKAVPVNIRPKMKDAIIYFAERFGAEHESENEKLGCGIRWVMENSLPQFERLINETRRYASYRDAEEFEDSFLTEKLIGAALEKWKGKINKSTDDDDD